MAVLELVKSFRFGTIVLTNVYRRNFSASAIFDSQYYNFKGKKTSSQMWLKRQLADPYVKQARAENYRCRSVFKLLEIDDKYHLLHKGAVVIDCGAAPGSWSEAAVERVCLRTGTFYLSLLGRYN